MITLVETYICAVKDGSMNDSKMDCFVMDYISKIIALPGETRNKVYLETLRSLVIAAQSERMKEKPISRKAWYLHCALISIVCQLQRMGISLSQSDFDSIAKQFGENSDKTILDDISEYIDSKTNDTNRFEISDDLIEEVAMMFVGDKEKTAKEKAKEFILFGRTTKNGRNIIFQMLDLGTMYKKNQTFEESFFQNLFERCGFYMPKSKYHGTLKKAWEEWFSANAKNK